MEYRRSLCPGCQHPKIESMDPANARAYEGVPVTCYACAARDSEKRRASAAISGGQYSDEAFDGVFVVVVAREEGVT
jgi:hypothetical protein